MLRSKVISAAALLKLNKPFKPVDSTWYMPNSGKDGHQEYIEERIPGAIFFDVDGIKTESPYPHMMPSNDTFCSALSKLGVNRSDLLVVYDKQGFFSAPRALWMLQVFKHPEVLILDNWAEYKKLGGKIESGEPAQPAPTTYTLESEPDSWVSYEYLREIVESDQGLAGQNIVLLDARPNPRFTGEQPEPRPGLSSGHVPGAISLPFSDVVKDGKMISVDETAKVLKEKGINTTKDTIVMCGSGVTACVIKLAIDPVLAAPARVYDGSWTEWASRATDLIEKSNA